MGLEAECSVRVGRRTFTGTALLEGELLLFRGETSLKIPFDEMREVSVEGPALVVKTSDQEAAFEVGAPVAERWLRLIKEPKSLFEKLEVGPLSRVAVVDIHDSLFLTALRERTAAVAEGRVPEGAPVVFFGADARDALRKVQLLRARMIDTGVLWIVRPKGSKDISEADVFEAIKSNGLVDTKVVSFSRSHTAHKCVIPVELRGQPIRQRASIVSIPPSAPAMQPAPATKPAPRPKTPTKPAPAKKKKAAPKKKAPAARKPPTKKKAPVAKSEKKKKKEKKKDKKKKKKAQKSKRKK
jgi:hypothetical protein